MNPLNPLLETQGFLVVDGALATELERHGADLDDPLWSARCLIEAPQWIERVHQDYLHAGADIISTATYQASEAGFRARGLPVQAARKLLSQGVRIALRARDRFWGESTRRAGRLKPLVAVSMGPFGACLHDGSEYHGNYAAAWSEVAEFHLRRTGMLAGEGAELLAFETIPSFPEAEVILDVLEHFPDQCAWISFSCRDESRVSHGEPFAAAVALAARHPRVVATGLNCTAPRFVSALLKSAGPVDVPLIAYPNSGETWEPDGNIWVGNGQGCFDPAEWYRAGARLIGGCCRTGPEDTARIRAGLHELLRG